MDNDMEFESLDDIIYKVNFVIEKSNWVFQLIVSKVPVIHLPNFNFEYSLCDCSQHQNFTHGKTWEIILNNDKPVIFTNTEILFKEFSDVSKNQFGNDKPGAAAFAQYFYHSYRDRFWKGDFSKLIFFVSDKNIDDIFQNVDFGGFASPFCTPWFMDNEEFENSNINFEK